MFHLYLVAVMLAIEVSITMLPDAAGNVELTPVSYNWTQNWFDSQRTLSPVPGLTPWDGERRRDRVTSPN